jgi:hypothetical protein
MLSLLPGELAERSLRRDTGSPRVHGRARAYRADDDECTGGADKICQRERLDGEEFTAKESECWLALGEFLLDTGTFREERKPSWGQERQREFARGRQMRQCSGRREMVAAAVSWLMSEDFGPLVYGHDVGQSQLLHDRLEEADLLFGRVEEGNHERGPNDRDRDARYACSGTHVDHPARSLSLAGAIHPGKQSERLDEQSALNS